MFDKAYLWIKLFIALVALALCVFALVQGAWTVVSLSLVIELWIIQDFRVDRLEGKARK